MSGNSWQLLVWHSLCRPVGLKYIEIAVRLHCRVYRWRDWGYRDLYHLPNRVREDPAAARRAVWRFTPLQGPHQLCEPHCQGVWRPRALPGPLCASVWLHTQVRRQVLLSSLLCYTALYASLCGLHINWVYKYSFGCCYLSFKVRGLVHQFSSVIFNLLFDIVKMTSHKKQTMYM